MPFGNQQLTDTGVGYLAQAQLGEQLRITRMQVGSGVAANLPDDLWPLTDLITPVMDIPIIASTYVTPDTIRVTGSLNSLDVPAGGGFELNEIGIMAECGTNIEALYSVDNTGGGGDFIPDVGSPVPIVQTLDLYIKISRATNITIAVSPAGIYEATNRGDGTIGPGPYIEKVGDILHFKRFVAGDGIEITEDGLVPPETIVIAQKKLKVDLDLFVSLGAPDIFPNFSTIQNAHNYLLDFYIPSNTYARINVSGETFISTVPIVINHPQGKQIHILGAPEVSTNIISVARADDTPTIPVVFTVSDGSIFIIGDYALVDIPVGGGSEDYFAYAGIYEVTAVAGNQVTIRHTNGYGWYPNSILTGGTLTKLASTLKFTGCPGFVLNNINLGLLTRFTLIGDRTAQCYGINVVNDASLNVGTIGINNFDQNIFLDLGGASLYGELVFLSNAVAAGLNAFQNTSVNIVRCIANGNTGIGITANLASTVTVGPDSVCCVNAGVGFDISHASLTAQYCFISSNFGGGIRGSNQSYVAGTGSSIKNNPDPIVRDGVAWAMTYMGFARYDERGYLPAVSGSFSYSQIDFSYIDGVPATPVMLENLSDIKLPPRRLF